MKMINLINVHKITYWVSGTKRNALFMLYVGCTKKDRRRVERGNWISKHNKTHTHTLIQNSHLPKSHTDTKNQKTSNESIARLCIVSFVRSFASFTLMQLALDLDVVCMCVCVFMEGSLKLKVACFALVDRSKCIGHTV